MVSLAPTTQLFRALPIVQPFYYSSSLFVDPLRKDIDHLLNSFVRAYADDASDSSSIRDKPFSYFKRLWKEQKWDYAHLAVLDSRGRIAFFDTVARVFLGN